MSNGITKTFLNRLKRKSLSNQIAIAVGSSLSAKEYSIPFLSIEIIKLFNINFKYSHPFEFFKYWNDLVNIAEKKIGKDKLKDFIKEKVSNSKPKEIHYKLASLPISNFVDTTFDRSLLKAMSSLNKSPICHDWEQQMMGRWKQSNPENPNLFFLFPNVESSNPWYGVSEPISKFPQNSIQMENIAEMLNNKDLILLDFSPYEAEFVLHLGSLVSFCEKIFNCLNENNNFKYWVSGGVTLLDISSNQLIDYLLPYMEGKYTFWDSFFPARKLVEINRDKQFDSFVSYFSGDTNFANKIYQELSLRGLHIWKDNKEIDVGDSMSDKIQEALKDSYSFTIILSPEALKRPWVKEELRAAYVLRLAGEFKILPVLYKECDIPPFLADYKYADFREERRFHEQIELLERSIRNAVAKARGKY